MKKKTTILLLVFGIFLNTSLSAQFVNIPDTAFRTWLNNNGYASCMNGTMMDTTCSLIVNATMVNNLSANITDLTGIQYFDNLDTLICTYNHITFLPPLHASLLYLKMLNNQFLTTIANFPSSLLYIEISHCPGLTSLPPLPPGLKKLYCYNLELQTLPPLPSTLTDLIYKDSPLYSLPALPAGLEFLDCSNDSLTNLPILPTSLRTLDCSQNYLTLLPTLPSMLSVLSCSGNQLTSLPALPSMLFYLACSYNAISTLPNLPPTLNYLDCNYNNLTSLPVLPNSLSELYCGKNQLTNIPALNSGLTELSCAYNPLTAYPVLPSLLVKFYCDSVQLPVLPVLPPSLDKLSCSYCPITTLPDLPDTLYTLNISNTQLTCLPPVKSIYSFNWSGTNLTCLPNVIQVQHAYPSIGSLSLCQPSGNCPVNWNISGNVFKDVNGNCIKDVSDDDLKIVPVKLDSSGIFVQEFLTNSSGDFSFSTGYGNYSVTIDTSQLPFDLICPSSFSYSTTLSASNAYDSLANFGLQCKPGFDLESKSISVDGLIRPGAQRKLYLITGDAGTNYGTMCSTNISGSVQAILSGPVSYVAPLPGAIAPTTVSGDTLTWIVPDFSLINPANDFNVQISISTAANIGDTLCVLLNISAASGDNNPANNTLSICWPVRNSFDPNAKDMWPSGAVDTSQQAFIFTVYFQNTGNAPAEDIYILDTLSNNLDASSFTFLSSSHNVITQLLQGNVLRFNFPDINLADSTNNEPESHGFVQFKLNRKAGLPPGTVISNKAYIYFDYNPAIITNTASATLTLPVGLNENHTSNSMTVYPNPSSGKLNILFAKPIARGTVEIQSILGEKILKQNIYNRSEMVITPENISDGIYFVKVFDGNETLCRKLIIKH